MANENEKPNPIVEMMAIDEASERERRNAPESELNVDPPEDKKALDRDDQGKFKGKDGEKKPDEKVEDKKIDEGKKPEVKTEEKPRDTVPLATFLDKTNKLKEQLDAKDITLKQYEARLAALEAKLTPAKEPDPEPDFVENPKGYVDHKLKGALDQIAEANKKAETEGKKAQETASQAAEQVQLQRFMTDLQGEEQRFIAQNPDYHDALAHLRTVRAAQLREFEPNITDAQIVDTIRREETGLAIQLARQGRNPVHTAYNLAKHYGYQPKAKGDQGKPAGEVAKLPEAPNRKLPPDQTLGAGASGNEDKEAYRSGETDPVDMALASLFKKRA